MKRWMINITALFTALCLCAGWLSPLPAAASQSALPAAEDGQDESHDSEAAESESGEDNETGEASDFPGPEDEPQDDTLYITAQNWPAAPEVSADGAILIDARTGTVLYEKNANHTFYPASITKIMTALLTAENSSFSETVTYSHEAVYSVPSGYASIAANEGEQMSVEDCMYALLLPSANDAANALGEHVAGSIEAFAQMMNERAAQLGAKHTHFVNPSGVHDETHVTTPYDMAMIMRACALNEKFMQVASARTYTIMPTNLQEEERPVANLHRMIFPSYSEYYEYAVAGKTGYTTPARNTLVTYAEKDDMQLICVVMHCSGTTYEDTETLLEYGFNNFTMYQPAQTDDRYTMESHGFFDSSFSQDRQASIEFAGDGWVILPNGVSFFDTEPQLSYVNQPEEDSDIFADLAYYYEGMEVGQARLRLITEAPDAFDFSQHSPEGETAAAQTEAPQPEEQVILINIWYIVGGVILILLIIIGIIACRRYNSETSRKIRMLRKRRKIKFKSNKKMKF